MAAKDIPYTNANVAGRNAGEYSAYAVAFKVFDEVIIRETLYRDAVLSYTSAEQSGR